MRERDYLRSKFPELFEMTGRLKDLEFLARNGQPANILNSSMVDKSRLLKSNTTILAVRCQDCAILAGDRRTSAGYAITSDSTQKLHKLTEFSGIGMAGRCSSSQEVAKILPMICNSYADEYDYELVPEGQVNVLASYIKWYWLLSLIHYDDKSIASVLASYDEEIHKPRIFTINMDGYSTEDAKFSGVGCGFSYVDELMEKEWRPDLNAETGLEWIIEKLGRSGKTSGGVSDFRNSPPTVAIIDRDGFKWVLEDKVKEIVNSIVKNWET